ncbi:biopolymer transporter ExbD, partial [Acetobacter sp. LMG 1627]|nr:biopolymer transporter ExbD [Acetobacter conturbans]NHN89610.1 biopolymer transporter ExbD [Acetobacter conturbans]
LADYRTVAHVLADAQRLGITKLGIVGQDQFMNEQ